LHHQEVTLIQNPCVIVCPTLRTINQLQAPDRTFQTVFIRRCC